MYTPTLDDIRDTFQQGGEAVIQLFDCTLQEMQPELQAPKDQLDKNSKNSNMLRGIQ